MKLTLNFLFFNGNERDMEKQADQRKTLQANKNEQDVEQFEGAGSGSRTRMKCCRFKRRNLVNINPNPRYIFFRFGQENADISIYQND